MRSITYAPCSTVVHIISRQSLIFDVILYFVQPSSLRYSSIPSPFPLYFHFHRPSSYVMLLSSQHMPIPPQPPFLDVICGFPHFRCLPYSFISILSSFITPHTHRSILISATSSLFSCALSNANVSAPYTSVGLTTVGPVHLPLDPPPQSIPAIPRCVNVFTFFNVSPCTWISAYWCSLHPKYLVFFLPIFKPRSSSALLHSSIILCTSSPLVGLLHNTMSSAKAYTEGTALWCPVPSHSLSCQTGRGSVRILDLDPF